MANINNKIPGLGFNHIALKVKDFQKSRDFYVNGLGMTPTVAWGEGENEVNMFDIGDGGILELFAGGGDQLALNSKWLHFAMSVDNVDQAYEVALAAGAEPLSPPKSVPLNSTPNKMTLRIAFVKGLDGEELEFFTIESKED